MEDFVKCTLALAGAILAGWLAVRILWWLLGIAWSLLCGIWWLICLPFTGAFWRGLFELSCCCAEGLVAGVCLVVFIIVFGRAFSWMTDWM